MLQSLKLFQQMARNTPRYSTAASGCSLVEVGKELGHYSAKHQHYQALGNAELAAQNKASTVQLLAQARAKYTPSQLEGIYRAMREQGKITKAELEQNASVRTPNRP